MQSARRAAESGAGVGRHVYRPAGRWRTGTHGHDTRRTDATSLGGTEEPAAAQLSKRSEYCISEKNSGDESGEFLSAGSSGGDECGEKASAFGGQLESVRFRNLVDEAVIGEQTQQAGDRD